MLLSELNKILVRHFDDAAKLAVFRRVRDEIQRVFQAYAAGRLDALRK